VEYLDPTSDVSPSAAQEHRAPPPRTGYPVVRQRMIPPGWPKALPCLVCGRVRRAEGPSHRLHEHCQLAISEIETRGADRV
jgi:hypothetical protein